MNPDPKTPGESGLQFDRAEFREDATFQCAICKTPLTGEFFQINGQAVCPSCRTRAESEIKDGTEFGRFAMALGVGSLAAVVGVVGYWLVASLIGFGGIIAVLESWLIGYAVRWGSRGKGGLPYQILAATLTYCAVGGSFARLLLPRQADLMDYLTAFARACALPWMEPGFHIFWWIVIAISLQQAWQMNRQVKLQISGPFFTRQSSPPAAS